MTQYGCAASFGAQHKTYMNKLQFGNLTRISKARARKLWGKQDISLCPCKLRPGFPWRPNIDVFASEIAEKLASKYEHERKAADFDVYVRNFEYYNCNMNETGYYTAFYLIQK